MLINHSFLDGMYRSVKKRETNYYIIISIDRQNVCLFLFQYRDVNVVIIIINAIILIIDHTKITHLSISNICFQHAHDVVSFFQKYILILFNIEM